MPTIEPLTEPFELPDGAVCLTPTGWRAERFEVIIQLQGGMTLQNALDALWAQHGGLLGEGTLFFKQSAELPHPKGFLVFVPNAG